MVMMARAQPILNEVDIQPVKLDTRAMQGVEKIRYILSFVYDPEIPVLTIADLGILRRIEQHEDKTIITITPTYTACPAMQTIEQDIHTALALNGVSHVEVVTQLSPAWTTDWLSEQGRIKMLAFGIAPPAERSGDKRALLAQKKLLACPQCASTATRLISEFGSTACKALYRCDTCLEPFDYFKCL